MDKETLVKALIAKDDSRARSMQTAIGVSSLGDCRRKVWHMNRGDQGTNPTRRLAAIMGTAIHTAIEAAIDGTDALIEHRVEVEGLPPATIDYFKDGEVIDWKTITLKNRDYFVTKQKRWQVQTYGYLLSQTGVPVHTVTLVGIPRDGSEDDILIHSEPYDETIALEALQWLKDVQAAQEPPQPERDPATFCKSYCPFFGNQCNGITKDLDGEPITDATAIDAAARYKEINVQMKQLEAEKEAAKTALEGVAGITIDGIKVSWSEIAGRSTPDLDAIEKALGGQPIPMKTGSPSIRLNIK